MDHVVEHGNVDVLALAVVLDDPVDGVLELLAVLDDLRNVLVDVVRVLGLLLLLLVFTVAASAFSSCITTAAVSAA